MRNEAYVRAVNNLEKVVAMAIDKKLLSEDNISTLRFNVFLLKMDPQYLGIEGKT